MSDVISPRSGIARLCVCERQMGTAVSFRPAAAGLREGKRPAFANSPSLKGKAKDGLWRGKRRTEGGGIAGRSWLKTVSLTTSMQLAIKAETPNRMQL